MKKSKSLSLKRPLATLLTAVVVEVFLFNFSAVKNSLSGSTQVKLSGPELEYKNWTLEEDGTRCSQPDPMICTNGLSVTVKTLTIHAEIDPMPSSYTIFYTTNPVESFSEKKMIVAAPVTESVEIPLGCRVYALRVDPGEEAGRVLYSISLSLNDLGWDISIPRIVAMLVIYWGTSGLMLLQKDPEYGIGDGGEARDGT